MIRVTKLAHVGINAVDLSKPGPAHHVLTLHNGPSTGLHHVALEVGSPDDIDSE